MSNSLLLPNTLLLGFPTREPAFSQFSFSFWNGSSTSSSTGQAPRTLVIPRTAVGLSEWFPWLQHSSTSPFSLGIRAARRDSLTSDSNLSSVYADLMHLAWCVQPHGPHCSCEKWVVASSFLWLWRLPEHSSGRCRYRFSVQAEYVVFAHCSPSQEECKPLWKASASRSHAIKPCCSWGRWPLSHTSTGSSLAASSEGWGGQDGIWQEGKVVNKRKGKCLSGMFDFHENLTI